MSTRFIERVPRGGPGVGPGFGTRWVSTVGVDHQLATTADEPILLIEATGYGIPDATQRWLMFFDADTVPSDGSYPIYQIQMAPPTSGGGFSWAPIGGQAFYVSLVAVLSSTPGSLTVDTSDVLFLFVRYNKV